MKETVYTKKVAGYGTFRSDSPPALKGFLKFGSVLFFGMAIMSLYLLFEEDMGEMRFISIVLILLFGGFGCLTLRTNKKLDALYQDFCVEVDELRKKDEAEAERLEQQKTANAEAFEKAHPHLKAEKFFKDARSAGITELKSEADIARLVLYAKNCGISKERVELIKDFNTGKQDVEHQENEIQLVALREEEAQLEKKYTQYADVVGSEKTIRICEDMCAQYREIFIQCNKDEISVKNGGEATYLLGKGKERSWVIHGGIASGIAGGAAGLAVAADVQRKNADIQKQNANLARSIAELQVFYLDEIWKRRSEAESQMKFWGAVKEAARMMLTESLDEQYLLSMLAPAVKSVEQSKTGAVKMKIELHRAPELRIYGDVDAVVDGSIKVLLKNNGKTVGTALCVADFDGVRGTRILDCICTSVSEEAEEYEITFAPHHLWAAEEKKF